MNIQTNWWNADQKSFVVKGYTFLNFPVKRFLKPPPVSAISIKTCKLKQFFFFFFSDHLSLRREMHNKHFLTLLMS